MNGRMMNYKKYYDYVNTMNQPTMPSELPKVKIRLRDMAAYAREKGVKVTELTESEIAMFQRKDQS